MNVLKSVNSCESNNRNVSVSELFNNYEIYEKRIRRNTMEVEWLDEMIQKDKWKYIM